jgi:hypothetical protein
MESWVIRCLYCDYERLKDPRDAYLAAPEPVHGPDEYPWKKEAILQASAYQAPPPAYTPPRDYCCTWAPLEPSTKTFFGVDQAQGVVEPMVENSPAASVEPVQEAAPAAETSPGFYVVELIQVPLAESTLGATDCPFCEATHALFTTRDHLDRPVIRCLHCSYSRPKNYPGAIQTLAQESNFGRHAFYPRPAQNPILQVVETSPGVEVDPVEDFLPECSNCFGDGYIEDEFRRIKFCQCEPKLSRQNPQSEIAQAVNISLDAKSDWNPILTPLTDSDSWNPAEFGEVLHKAEASGQLNLLEWDVRKPPEPDDYDSMFAFWNAYDRWLLSNELNEIIHSKNDATTGTVRGARATSVPPGCDLSAKPNGASSDRQDERLAVQKGDRLLEKKGADSGDTGQLVSCQPAQLVPQAPIVPPQAPIVPPQAPAQPTEKSPRSGCKSEFKIGMLVGRRSDRQHIGKILNIYQSRRGIWRAKIQPLNKSNFVYFDCATLIEQRLLYDYEMRPGGFILTGEIFNKAKCEHFEVFSRKVRPPTMTNWRADELNSLSIFKLKQIARDMQIQAIPGTVGKRSIIRAILAEQAILQERRTAQLDRETGPAIAQKQKSGLPANKTANKTANKRKRAGASPLVGNQLSLFDVAV